MKSDQKIIFLTGGTGMVGRNILAHYKANNWKIISPSSSELDLRDYDATVKVLRKIKK